MSDNSQQDPNMGVPVAFDPEHSEEREREQEEGLGEASPKGKKKSRRVSFGTIGFLVLFLAIAAGCIFMWKNYQKQSLPQAQPPASSTDHIEIGEYGDMLEAQSSEIKELIKRLDAAEKYARDNGIKKADVLISSAREIADNSELDDIAKASSLRMDIPRIEKRLEMEE